MNKSVLVTLLVLSAPLALVVLNPSMELGALGLALGAFGTFVSPFMLLGAIVYIVIHWRRGESAP